MSDSPTSEQKTKLLEALKQNKLQNGAKSTRAGMYLTDEKGLGSEVIITKDGVLRQLNAGDMVFNAAQKETLWNLSKENLSSLDKIRSSILQSNITNHYDSLLTVNGDVTRDALPELQEILRRACEYTKKDMYMSSRKKGF